MERVYDTVKQKVTLSFVDKELVPSEQSIEAKINEFHNTSMTKS